MNDRDLNAELFNNGKKPVGRPKSDGEKKKHFNLLVTPSMLTRLNKAVGLKQAETGEKWTVSALLNDLAEKYLRENDL